MKHTLDWEYTPEYELLGLSSSKGCHRLAWAMNRSFGWSLECDQDVLVSQPNGEVTTHPSMRFDEIESGTCVTLVLNRVPNGVLAKSAANMDFLMMVNHHDLAIHEIMGMLRTLSEISFVTVLDPLLSGAMEPLMQFD